jgi:glycoside/pentoside/hexuronide:cation symporter, GPH family
MSNSRKATMGEMIGYASGNITSNLSVNAISTFAMLYYTGALGLSAVLAGTAMSISIFWDAIIDPVMGYISDRTRSKRGRRHPYIFVGGILLSVCFFFLWYVPGVFRSSETILFCYLVVINLLLRTAWSIFGIPYGALGFEVSTDYLQRTKLQGIGVIFNMGSNFLGCAMAWVVFFPRTEDIEIARNYIIMGTVFSVVMLIAMFISYYCTRKHILDSRKMIFEKTGGNPISSFFGLCWEVLRDKYAKWVFIMQVIVMLGTCLVATLQMYVYQYYMQFDGAVKTCVHGGTMVGCLLGAAIAYKFVEIFDKKKTIYIGGVICMICGALLAAVLLTKMIVPHSTISAVIFGLLGGGFWFGNGMLMPVSVSMIADASEANLLRTGDLKDGSYNSILIFASKVALSVGSFIAGAILTMTGFQSGVEVQSFHTMKLIIVNAFLLGPLIALIAVCVIKFYSLTDEKMDELRKNAGVE